MGDPREIACYLCQSPRPETLRRLAEVAGARYTIEQCFEEGKGEAGLDHYEVRQWSSWQRHITLSMLALAWLASIRIQEALHGGSVEARGDGLGKGSELIVRLPSLAAEAHAIAGISQTIR